MYEKDKIKKKSGSCHQTLEKFHSASSPYAPKELNLALSH
jgi:hypothetical protein